MTKSKKQAVLDELASLEDEKILAVNQRHGDDHAVNLTKLRAVAKPLKKDPELARELWATGESAPRLVALLISRPKDFSEDEYDEMLRDARTPKVIDWLINYLVKKSPVVEDLRVRWFDDPEENVAAAAWELTSDRVVKNPEGIDLEGLLDQIEKEMVAAPGRLQWGMNTCLAQIGIHHPELRERALAIGERLEVLKDYPTAPNCISPFAPIWIREMVARAEPAK